MATIKSFTSLEQSKKLAEILPLESADMCYTSEDFVDEDTGDVVSIEKVSFGHPSNTEIGCWSLAALLDVLPSSIVDSSDNRHFRVHCMKRFTEWYDNAIDACVAMIEKLNELKML